MPLKLNSTSGGSVTLQEPTTASNRTLTLPDNTGTLLSTASTFAGTGPAFNAYASSAQNISNGTTTKVSLNAEAFDTNSNFDSTTNYRFTPTVAGYYFIQGNVTQNGSSWTNGYINCLIYKNGSSVLTCASQQPTNGNWAGCSVSGLVYMNGSTDYIELYTEHNGAATNPLGIITGQTLTFMSGFLARAA
jgi:hypothetical protein